MNSNTMNLKNNKTAIAYIGIIFVVFVWATMPLLKKVLIGNSYSASIYNAVTALVSAFVLMFINRKQLKSIDKSYFKVAVPTGVALGIASLSQALAFKFNASPTNQAFLENLSCVIVPIILFVFTRKKPGIITVISVALCILSSCVLTGVFSGDMRFAVSDILNALAGILYGVNIAFTGIYSKKLTASIYIMIQLFVKSLISFVMVIAFNFISIGGELIDPFMFKLDLVPLVALLAIGVVSNALCWTIRTSSMKHVSVNAVAVIMPFSAVLTGVFAVIAGQDKATVTLLLGAALGLIAGLTSAVGDIIERKNK